MNFIILSEDQPSLADELREYVLPGRLWKKRFHDLTGYYIRNRKGERL
mgnify:FL=1